MDRRLSKQEKVKDRVAWCATVHGITESQTFLPFIISQSLLKFMSIESVMLSNHLILCTPFSFCLLSFLGSGSSPESALHIRWPEYWSCSISPSNEYSGLISLGLTGLILLQFKELSRVFSSTTIQKHQFFGTQLSHLYMTTRKRWVSVFWGWKGRGK